MRVRGWSVCALALVGLAFAGAANAYDVVRVLSGGEILANAGGRQVILKLAAVTVPAPPGPKSIGEYRGAEARDFMVQVLRSQNAFVREAAPVAPGATTIPVRIRVGAQGERDLSALMAEAGLATLDPMAQGDADFLALVKAAERDARVNHRGIYDGGYQAFSNARSHMVDLGVGTLSGDKPRTAYGQYLQQLAGSKGGGASAVQGHTDAVSAIRDWGSSLGLPPDSSALGH